ncbi:GMC family oxidoreductase N-terminal domain-containing protein [Streptomyces noursei]|uniref:GMC family oxidoreductase N-terminal domain-containing protein n=1 Tax=Streptomyces noursei TaxID=1971 RepID=UPI001352096E
MTGSVERVSEREVLAVGSGFGESVAALRLAEKGYRVTVVETGRRWQQQDFAGSAWQVHRVLWAPWLGWQGILRLRVRRRLVALTGIGVGGGSLAYAGVHYRPDADVFRAACWDPTVNWGRELAPYYALAERMLGTAQVARAAAGDAALRKAAEALGMADSVHATRVGIHFGPPGQKVADPYFAGRGPSRAGCTECGRCTIGCQLGAKNSLDHNYLYLAEQLGVDVRPLTTARALVPLPDGSWQVHTVHGRGAGQRPCDADGASCCPRRRCLGHRRAAAPPFAAVLVPAVARARHHRANEPGGVRHRVGAGI